MIVLTEWNGSVIDQSLGLSEPSLSWFSADFFSVTEYVFFVIFFVDVLVKVGVSGNLRQFTRERGVI